MNTMLTALCLIAWTVVLVCWNIRSEKLLAPQFFDRRKISNSGSDIPVGKPTDSGL